MTTLFLGVDGGQSHTTALIADGRGKILALGNAGPSNHTREPGGRERLISAVTQSVEDALRQAGLLKNKIMRDVHFASAHLAMTGEPEDKIEIVREILQADHLIVGHDAPAALAGALAGGEGVIVLAGTGSVACGQTRDGRFARIGGHGYMFGDEGSAFAIAVNALSLTLASEDREAQDDLKVALLKHFKRDSLKAIAENFYAGNISRDRLASFAARVGNLGDRKDRMARIILDDAAEALAEMVIATVVKLQLHLPDLCMNDNVVQVSYGGGVFKSARLMQVFVDEVRAGLPEAKIVPPRFGPDVGALLLAYRQAGKKITPTLLDNIANTNS